MAFFLLPVNQLSARTLVGAKKNESSVMHSMDGRNDFCVEWPASDLQVLAEVT